MPDGFLLVSCISYAFIESAIINYDLSIRVLLEYKKHYHIVLCIFTVTLAAHTQIVWVQFLNYSIL